MGKYWVYFLVFLFLQFSCKNKPPDGSYCANITYNSPGQQRQTHQMLLVDVKDNHLTKIYFPGDHFDLSQIKSMEIPQDGKLTITSSAGHVYKIEMKGAPEKCKPKPKKSVPKHMTQCKGKSKEGKRCQRMTDDKSGFCWQHK